MRAVDTNILARFYLRDDAAQGGIAAGVLSGGDVNVPKTMFGGRSQLVEDMHRVLEDIAKLISS